MLVTYVKSDLDHCQPLQRNMTKISMRNDRTRASRTCRPILLGKKNGMKEILIPCDSPQPAIQPSGIAKGVVNSIESVWTLKIK